MTFRDVTKDELIEYFFNPLAGGHRIPADKERFFIWVKRHREGIMIDTQEECAEEAHKSFREYIEWLRKANDEKDLDKKIELHKKANAAYERYEKLNKEYDRLSDKIDKSMGVGKYWKGTK